MCANVKNKEYVAKKVDVKTPEEEKENNNNQPQAAAPEDEDMDIDEQMLKKVNEMPTFVPWVEK